MNRTTAHYFKNTYVCGASQMYFMFMANVMRTNTEARIIPMQTASQNGMFFEHLKRFASDYLNFHIKLNYKILL